MCNYYITYMKFKQNQIKVRRTWGEMSPVTKVKESNKKYSRAKENREFRNNREY